MEKPNDNTSVDNRMTTARLEIFSDGVMAIIITIMVLELKVPHDVTIEKLLELGPIFLSYVLSFIYVGIYWSNHHHMLHVVEKVNGQVLWANLHLLFWLSLIPFVSGLMGENQFAPITAALYGGVLLLSAIAYYILGQVMIRLHGKDSLLAAAIGSDRKGIRSIVLYAVAIPLAFVHQTLALAFYAVVAVIWLVPDRRVEKVIKD